MEYCQVAQQSWFFLILHFMYSAKVFGFTAHIIETRHNKSKESSIELLKSISTWKRVH